MIMIKWRERGLMLYTIREGHDGIQFYPIRDYNVYIYCKQCKRFVQIPEPAGYIAEVGAVGASIKSLDLCDECIEANSAAEEEYCKVQSQSSLFQLKIWQESA